jgi:hypothetical protein
LRETTDTVAGYDVMLGQLRQSFGEIQEAIGKGLQPVLQQMQTVLVPIIQKISDWVIENPKLTANLILAAGAIALLVAGLGTLGLVLPAVIAGVGLLASPFVVVGAIVATFIATIWALNEAVKILQTDSGLVLEGIKLYWQDFISWIMKLLKPFIDWVVSNWKIMSDGVMAGLTAITDAFKPFIDSVKNAYDWVKKLVDKASELGGDLLKKITGKKASGGGVGIGGSYLVGEQGPELFTPATTGSITPNHQLAGAGGGMNLTINMNGTFMDNADTVAERLGDRIIQSFKMINRF